MNPVPGSSGLCLNIDESDNALDLSLVRSVAPYFRIKDAHATTILDRMKVVVREWREIAESLNIKRGERDEMAVAFTAR